MNGERRGQNGTPFEKESRGQDRPFRPFRNENEHTSNEHRGPMTERNGDLRRDYRTDKPFRPRVNNNDDENPRVPIREPRTFNSGQEFGRGRGIGMRGGGMRRPYGENQRFNNRPPFNGGRGGMERPSARPATSEE